MTITPNYGDTTPTTFGLTAPADPAQAGMPTPTGWDGISPVAAPRTPFTPDYTPKPDTRIFRQKLRANAGGVATATFRGTLDATASWIEQGRSGRLSIYAEVTATPDGMEPEQTTLRIALIPTGKRVPANGLRLGGANGTWAYLIDTEVGPVPAPQADDEDDSDSPDGGYSDTDGQDSGPGY